jgi:hypothetical protein
MMRLKPDFWIDADYLADPSYWPPTDFHRSIYQYHICWRSEWLDADLVLERIIDQSPTIIARSICNLHVGLQTKFTMAGTKFIEPHLTNFLDLALYLHGAFDQKSDMRSAGPGTQYRCQPER